MKGCFIYLVNHTEQAVADGVKSLALLHANYLDRFPAPVMLFHEDGLTDEMKVRLASATDGLVAFARVDFSAYPIGTGYNHMCRFFAGEVFKHPVLQAFDYVCRLDTDSFILAPVTYDLFDAAQRTSTYYGFLNDEIRDNPEFCAGLSVEVARFKALHPNIHAFADPAEGRLYYTNFEICYLPWFRSSLWQSFYRFLDESGGIYAHRWGDHIIRYAGVGSFMPPQHIQQFDIPYSHQGIGVSHAA